MKKHTIVILVGLIFLATVMLNAVVNYDPADQGQALPPHMGHVWDWDKNP